MIGLHCKKCIDEKMASVSHIFLINCFSSNQSRVAYNVIKETPEGQLYRKENICYGTVSVRYI
jgi:hypothetical protein